MSNISQQHDDSEMLGDYSAILKTGKFKGVRGKYHQEYHQLNGTVPVKIESETGDRYVKLRTIETEAMITDDGQITAEGFAELNSGKYSVTIIIEEPVSLPES